jgi:hypothetical protein
MTFTITIKIVNDALAGLEITDNARAVSIGAALQAMDVARAALLNIPIAQALPLIEGAPVDS